MAESAAGTASGAHAGDGLSKSQTQGQAPLPHAQHGTRIGEGEPFPGKRGHGGADGDKPDYEHSPKTTLARKSEESSVAEQSATGDRVPFPDSQWPEDLTARGRSGQAATTGTNDVSTAPKQQSGGTA